MKRIALYLLTLSFFLAACDKDKNGDAAAPTLDGRWTLIRIQDKSTSQMLAAPQGSAGKIFLQIAGDKFMGQTMINNIYDGQFELKNSNALRVNAYSMTKLAENEWDGAFLTVLSSCSLQSVSPCAASWISWLSPTTIKIDSPLRYAITLEKF